ncbi:hypothetical protein Y032_0030g2201 [Ancylostoma ceylanicum]|uniref:F-box domain-containing protein n=1 Tax=Ancylostoma ceylanicum TaxID=53326 RepID=A0A016UQI4_9BILA|nr:hypothetical protein Y032_0030g2201 [Ancylostoma ceylanicum]
MDEDMGPHSDSGRVHEESRIQRWIELPVDVKIKILQYIPFPTLRNLMFLSKESHLLVTRTNIPIVCVRVSDIDSCVGFFRRILLL